MEQTQKEIKEELEAVEKKLEKKPDCNKLREKAKAIRAKMAAKSKGAAADFRKFAFKGNIIDLAIAVIIGGVFGKIVTSLVNDIIMPAIAMLFGQTDFTDLAYKSIKYGEFIQAVFNFFLVAISIYIIFKIVMFFRGLAAKRREKNALPPVPPALTKTEELLTDIKELLTPQQPQA